MDEQFPKMWVQGFCFFFSSAQQDLSWKDVSLITFVLECYSLKEKSLVLFLQEAVKPYQARSTRI